MASTKWNATKYPGIKYREHPSRKIGASPIKDKYYVICYRYCGKLKWESLGWQTQGVTLADAINALARAKMAIVNGEKVVTIRDKKEASAKFAAKEKALSITLSQYWNTFYKGKLSDTLKPDSFRRTEGIYRVWLLPLFGDRPLREIDARDWDALRTAMKEKGSSMRTMEYISGEFRRILQDAEGRGYPLNRIPTSKQTGMTAPKDNRRQRTINHEETELILTELKTREINTYRFVKFAFLTGCRFSEIAGLRWENITATTVVFMNTKNKSDRKLLLTSPMKTLFDSLPHESEYVFLNTKGEPFKEPPQAFSRTIDKFNLNEGRDMLDRITFHTIRHTVATKLAEHLNIRSLMDFMGWKRVEMAARYIHANNEATLKAAERLGDMFTFEG